ncbi:MAG TPA: hypothetical protein VGK39_02635 [Cyclobacteriaceae bacterium]
MKRVVGLIVLVTAVSVGQAQIHVSKLVIKSKQKYSFGESDIVVADTLIMEDSSSIELNSLKRENYLHSKVLIVGNHCSIVGSGINGKQGRAGRAGNSPVGPCKSGTSGTQGGRGLDGTPGVNLFLYLEHVTLKSHLIIDLHGGDGGTGGIGGEGGSGTSGIVHCNGGNGGYGGNAGNGANGGDGGSVSIHCPAGLSELVNKNFKIKNYGGAFGRGGRGGYPGSGGLGPSGRNGKNGMPGEEGFDGFVGKNGKISIVHN